MLGDLFIGQFDSDVARSPLAKLMSAAETSDDDSSNDDYDDNSMDPPLHWDGMHSLDKLSEDTMIEKHRNSCDYESSKKFQVRGLRNNGQICYFNSIIQALASTESFISFLGRCQARSITSRDYQANLIPTDFVGNLLNLLKYVNGEPIVDNIRRGNSLAATVLMDIFPKALNIWQQQDAQEFLLLIMEKIDRICLESPMKGWSISSLKCSNCGYVKPVQNQIFITLALSTLIGSSSIEQMLDKYSCISTIENVECNVCSLDQVKCQLNSDLTLFSKALERGQRNRGKTREDVHLKHQIDEIKNQLGYFSKLSPADESFESKFCKVDYLTDDESEYIPILRRQFYNRELVSRPPKIFAFHIHRRTATSKIRKPVAFPLILNMAKYLVGNNCPWVAATNESQSNDHSKIVPIKYSLRSVVEHLGSAEGGHYLTYRRVRMAESNAWVCVSDDKVKFVDWSIVSRAEAYLLFYEKMT